MNDEYDCGFLEHLDLFNLEVELFSYRLYFSIKRAKYSQNKVSRHIK